MYSKYLSPLGIITYEFENEKIISLSISDLNVKNIKNEFTDKVDKELLSYFSQELKNFNVPINFKKGTSFQLTVWNELKKIPYGKTISYKDLAIRINKPNAYRAVGQACKRNPIGIIVPCHRVLGSDNSLVGYSGKNFIDLKKQLLDLESMN